MVSRTITMLLTMLLVSSLASAEIYRWEDENGANFTDDSSSVPEKFREKIFAEADAQPENTTPPVKIVMYRHNNPVAYQESKAAVRLANLEQKRSAAEATKQKQLHTEDFQNTLQSLAFYIKIGVSLGVILFVIWMVTIVDIMRSEFITPSNKTVWLLLVLLLPLIGMLHYMFLGSNYKA
jgi:hypothetical protein